MKTFRMKTCTVQVETGKLLTLKQGLQPKAHLILDKAAFDIEATAKTLAVVDTGAMRASIYVSGASRGGSNYPTRKAEALAKIGKTGRSGRTLTQVNFNSEVRARSPFERIIAPSVVYAIYPELRGKPYIAPAVETHRGPFVKAWKALLVT